MEQPHEESHKTIDDSAKQVGNAVQELRELIVGRGDVLEHTEHAPDANCRFQWNRASIRDAEKLIEAKAALEGVSV